MRVSDWHQRLTTYLLDVRRSGKVLSWSEFSCAKFASGAVEAVTGKDWHKELGFDGAYHDEASAAEAIRNGGYLDLADLTAHHYPVIQPSETQFGDLVAVRSVELDGDLSGLPQEMRFCLGVAEPPFVWVIAYKGIGRIRLMNPNVVTGFRVG